VSKVFMRRVVAGVLAALALTTLVAADQQRTGQRPPQKEPSRDQRGGPPGPPGEPPQRLKWWQDEKVIAELRLAPEQSARIEEIFQAESKRMKPVVDDLNRRQELLSNLISGNDVTEAEVLKQADQVEALRSTLSKSRTLMLFRFRRVLSAEQRAKLVEFQKAQDRDRRQGRPPDRVPGER
jgi:Spy/CpxP family protein refolding chaperone